MLSASMIVVPPEDGGGAATMRAPRYSPYSGLRSATR